MSSKYSYLQRSHFRLGGKGPMEQSSYMQDFTNADVSAQQKLEEFQRANLRKSHFAIGGAPDQNGFTSESKASFVPRETAAVERAINLHHIPGSIKLGSDATNYVSSNRAQFTCGDTRFSATKAPKLQSTHFALGHGSDDYSTAMRDDFQPISQEHFPSKQSKDFQKTAFKTDEGYAAQYVTEASANFVPHPSHVPERHDLQKFQHSSVKLADGHSGYPMSSTREQLLETANAGSAKREPVANLHLKGSSFKLAETNAFHDVSEARACFQEKDDTRPAEIIKPHLQDTKAHVCCPDDNEMAQPSRALDFKVWDQDFDSSTAQKIKAFMLRPTDPNSTKGAIQQGSYVSSMRHDFRVTSDSNQLDEAAKNRRRHLENHIQMRYDPSTQPYQTTTHQSLQETRDVEDKAGVAAIDNKLRQSHISLSGSKAGQYVTEHQSQFFKREGGQRDLDEAVQKDLRRSHYSLGHDKTNYTTSFRDEIKAHDDYHEDGQYIGASRKFDEYVYM